MFNTLLSCVFLFGWEEVPTNTNQYISLRETSFKISLKSVGLWTTLAPPGPCTVWGAVEAGPELLGCCRGTGCHKGLWRRQRVAHTGHSVTTGLDLTPLWGLSSAGFCDLSRDLTLSFGWDAKHGLLGAELLLQAPAALCVHRGHSLLACLGGDRRKAVLSPDSQLLPLAAGWRRWGAGWGQQRCPYAQSQMASSLQGVKPGLWQKMGESCCQGGAVIIRAHGAMALGWSCGSRTLPRLEAWWQGMRGCFHYGCHQEAGHLIRSATPWREGTVSTSTWGGCSPSRNSRASDFFSPATPGEDSSSLPCGDEAVQAISPTSSCVQEADNMSVP